MKIKVTAAALLCVAALLLGSCAGGKDRVHTYSGEIGGKAFSVSYLTEYKDGDKTVKLTEEELAQTDKEAEEALLGALNILSSGINEVNSAVNAIADPDTEFAGVLEKVYSVAGGLNGAYEPVFGAVTKLYRETDEVSGDMLAAAMQHTGMSLILLENGVIRKADTSAELDASEFASGFAAASVTAYLRGRGFTYGTVAYNGTVGTFGAKDKSGAVTAELYMTSGEHKGKLKISDTYASVINRNDKIYDYAAGTPQTGMYDTAVVISADAVVSDILSRVIYTMEFSEIDRLYDAHVFDFEAVVVYENGEYKMTAGAAEGEIYESETETEKQP